MLVALTGASGFFGSHLALQLHSLGHQIRGMVRPSSDQTLLRELGAELLVGGITFDESLRELVHGVDAVIHNAWNWDAHHAGPRANWETNVAPGFRLLEEARQAGVRQFLFISSVAVFGSLVPGRPLDEAHPVWPDTLYGGSKAALENLVMAYHPQYGLNTSSWRPAAIYGIRPHHPDQATWRDVILSVAAGEPFDSDAGVSANSAEDTAQAVALAVGRDEVAGKVYNLVDCYVYLQQIAELARELSGSQAPIVDRVGNAEPRYRVLSDKARQLGARLDRELDGIREHVRRVLELA